MESKQDLELTIRTATLIKSLSQLIGARDPLVSKMILIESAEQWDALAQFILSIQAKRPDRAAHPNGGSAT